MIKELIIPSSVTAMIDGDYLIIKGPLGENKRLTKNPLINIMIKKDKLIIKSIKDSKKFKRVINSYASHIKNMIEGVINGYSAELKIAYSHFPINIKEEGGRVLIENFVGEKKPRVTKLMPGTELRVDGNKVIIKGIDKEAVGQSAGNIECITQIKHKDRRVFQDGIWITKKP